MKWSGEYTFRPTEGHVYEYACHEGNYAIPNILNAGRARDRWEEARCLLHQATVSRMLGDLERAALEPHAPRAQDGRWGHLGRSRVRSF